MSFKQFISWCNERACDGYWGMITAIACMDIYHKIKALPFWKREKVWRDNYEQQVLNEIVNPINAKIAELTQID